MPLAHSLSDQDFFSSYFHLYLSDELSSNETQRFNELLKQEEFQNAFSAYKEKRGFIQLKLQAMNLSEKERISLQNKIRDSDATMTMEQAKIIEMEQAVQDSNLYRTLTMLGITLAIVGGIYYLFAPSAKESFDPLNALAYEAIAMEEDVSGDRLYMPGTNPEDIRQYFLNSPGLNFKPRILDPLLEGWSLEGSSVIDYEIIKIAVVQYKLENKEERLFFFTFPGELDSLPDSDEGIAGSFRYNPYASDRVNMIAWQDSPGTLAMLIGHLSISDLAKVAAFGTK